MANLVVCNDIAALVIWFAATVVFGVKGFYVNTRIKTDIE